MNYDLDVIPGCLGKEGTFLKPPDTKDYDTWLDGIPLNSSGFTLSKAHVQSTIHV